MYNLFYAMVYINEVKIRMLRYEVIFLVRHQLIRARAFIYLCGISFSPAIR